MSINDFDVIVIGGGHAGIEACVAPAKLGLNVALITMDASKIGLMSCNPAIGGLAKGQLVREIDALGGEMAKIIDASGIHFKMLNKSKGPAVWSPRAQADRAYYAQVARKRLQQQDNLTIIENSVNGLDIFRGAIRGVSLDTGERISARTVIVTAGTFLNGIIYIGLQQVGSGRAGEKPATGITESLAREGFESGRLKTGTPPRLHKDSINYEILEPQEPDNPPQPFSFWTKEINRKQVNCFIAHTNERTHAALREGFDESPMFTGRIKSVGPRYCPSIEDKVNRFSDRPRHQLFLEPEGYESKEMYLNGFSTSLPEKIQVQAIHSITGLERAEIIRLGYAVEYDFFPPHQLKYTLETKITKNLFFAGQISGTSGYEEAAAQGIIAGINAAMNVIGGEPFKLKRSEAYIGVLIDDLINKSTLEPYRMFTSRAEFRLQLRQDNADLRLARHGRRLGLLSKQEYSQIEEKSSQIDSLKKYVVREKILPEQFNDRFKALSSPIENPIRLADLAKRPEISLRDVLIYMNQQKYTPEVVQEVEFGIKYEGYIKRNQALMDKFQQYEERGIPDSFDYGQIDALSNEAKEKLLMIKPASFGQASRISGVSPADLSVLLIHLERIKYRKDVSRGTINKPR